MRTDVPVTSGSSSAASLLEGCFCSSVDKPHQQSDIVSSSSSLIVTPSFLSHLSFIASVPGVRQILNCSTASTLAYTSYQLAISAGRFIYSQPSLSHIFTTRRLQSCYRTRRRRPSRVKLILFRFFLLPQRGVQFP